MSAHNDMDSIWLYSDSKVSSLTFDKKGHPKTSDSAMTEKKALESIAILEEVFEMLEVCRTLGEGAVPEIPKSKLTQRSKVVMSLFKNLKDSYMETDESDRRKLMALPMKMSRNTHLLKHLSQTERLICYQQNKTRSSSLNVDIFRLCNASWIKLVVDGKDIDIEPPPVEGDEQPLKKTYVFMEKLLRAIGGTDEDLTFLKQNYVEKSESAPAMDNFLRKVDSEGSERVKLMVKILSGCCQQLTFPVQDTLNEILGETIPNGLTLNKDKDGGHWYVTIDIDKNTEQLSLEHSIHFIERSGDSRTGNSKAKEPVKYNGSITMVRGLNQSGWSSSKLMFKVSD